MTRQLKDFMAKGAHHLDIQKTSNEHKMIVSAIREKKPEKAMNAMRSHLIAAWDLVREFNNSAEAAVQPDQP
jgi:DNA-binding FadR family transcriptional regulator